MDFCNSHHTSLAINATSEEGWFVLIDNRWVSIKSISVLEFLNSISFSRLGWRPTLDVQLSLTKALRTAMLKQRLADTILKVQHKNFLDHVSKFSILEVFMLTVSLSMQYSLFPVSVGCYVNSFFFNIINMATFLVLRKQGWYFEDKIREGKFGKEAASR